MPPKINSSAPVTTPAPNSTAATNASTTPASSSPVRPSPQSTYATSDERGGGVVYQEGDSTEARAPGYPRNDSFGNLPAGYHKFIVSVNDIIPWHFGDVVAFRVEFGPDRGRQIDWAQSEGTDKDGNAWSAKRASVWRSQLFGAYAAGGWTLEPNPATGWPGWPKNKAGASLPPYDAIFVHECADKVLVPVLLAIEVQVDADYEKYPKVLRVSHYLIDGTPVQAPMPRRTPPWLARQYKWVAADDVISTGSGHVVKVAKPDYKQVPLGHGGLKTYRQIGK